MHWMKLFLLFSIELVNIIYVNYVYFKIFITYSSNILTLIVHIDIFESIMRWIKFNVYGIFIDRNKTMIFTRIRHCFGWAISVFSFSISSLYVFFFNMEISNKWRRFLDIIQIVSFALFFQNFHLNNCTFVLNWECDLM